MTTVTTLGWREWIGLPGIGIDRIKCKVDTGARSSALHTSYIEPFDKQGQRYVRFGVNPNQRDFEYEVDCEEKVADQRLVRDSGGHQEMRFVIVTPVTIGGQDFEIELTLTQRKRMLFRMLLGRTAMRNRFLVDPTRSFLATNQ